jgi:hypothetical protein
MRRYVLKSIIVVCPFRIALFPSRNMLADDVRALFLRFGNRDMSIETECSCWIVDRYQTLPGICELNILIGSNAQLTIAELLMVGLQQHPDVPFHIVRKKHPDRHARLLLMDM